MTRCMHSGREGWGLYSENGRVRNMSPVSVPEGSSGRILSALLSGAGILLRRGVSRTMGYSPPVRLFFSDRRRGAIATDIVGQRAVEVECFQVEGSGAGDI